MYVLFSIVVHVHNYLLLDALSSHTLGPCADVALHLKHMPPLIRHQRFKCQDSFNHFQSPLNRVYGISAHYGLINFFEQTVQLFNEQIR